MPNDITVTKNTTSGSERWDVAYTADQAATVTKTLLTTGDLLDRNIKVSITTPSGSATTPTTSVTLDSKSMNIISSTGVVTSTMSGSANITPTISAGYISAVTAGTVSASGSQTLQLTTQSGATVTPTTTEQTAVSAGRYTLGAIKVAGDANLVAGNIKTGVSIFGVNGSYSGQSINNQQKSVDPSETAQTVTPDTGYTGLSEVNVSAISSTYVGSGITRRSSTDLTASGATITAPAGYYESSASKSVSTMTLPTSTSTTSSGTNKATIGRSTSTRYINIPTGYNSSAAYYTISAVPNGSVTAPSSITGTNAIISYNAADNLLSLSKSVSVTPDVTTAGYISSGTAGNSAVILTANVDNIAGGTITPTTSEQTIISSAGAYYVSGAVKVGAMATGSVTAPSSISGSSATVSTGTNTLTLSKTVSVTPNVTTAGYISSGTAGNSSVSLTATVTTKAAATITPGTTNQTISSGTYLTGTQTIEGDANLIAENIAEDVTIFGVTGTFQGGVTLPPANGVDF